MKRLFLIFLLTVSTLAFSTPKTAYSIKVFKGEKVLKEVSIESHDKIESTVTELCKEFPTADRLEIEPVESTVVL